jgi:membrane-associated phospholipid phosphatase
VDDLCVVPDREEHRARTPPGPLLPRTGDRPVSTLVVLAAQDLLYLLVAVGALVWLLLDRRGKVALAVGSLAGLVLVGVGIWVAAHLHSDPRPFVSDGSRALFAHPADNGFPSDHSAAAALLATVVARSRRVAGALLGAGAVVVAWARVAAHVHHAQDVVAGLGIGVLAGLVGILLAPALLAPLDRRGLLPVPRTRR